MNELPRINTLAPLTYAPDTTVAPTAPAVADKKQKVQQEDRRRSADRRKRNKKPVIERRVSSDRRGPLLDETA